MTGAQILFSNGILEEIHPSGTVFTEEELISYFNGYNNFFSKRLDTVPNTWCLWAEKKKKLDDEYNNIASVMLDIDIFSPILFIHDSAINPNWQMVDDILYKNYEEYKTNLLKYIDDVVNFILSENLKEEEENENKDPNSILNLEQLGITDDKRVLYSFNPKSQNPQFYSNNSFAEFADKLYNHIKRNYKKNFNPFELYTDNKIIIITDDKDVPFILDKMNETFEKKEYYEKCADIKKIKTYIVSKLNPVKKKRKRKTKRTKVIKE